MAVSIIFMSEDSDQVINNLAGSGLGFFGPTGTNSSLGVGSYQDTTYITNATGNASNAIKVNNIKYVAPNSGQIAGGEIRALTSLPNYLASLQIRVQSDGAAVRCQNPELRIFDRNDINVPAVGVLTKVAVLCHPWTSASPAGSGSLTWYTPGGSGSVVSWNDFPTMVSPGSGGLAPSGASTTDTIHDYFAGISVTPTSIGSKTNYALAFSVEFI